MKSRVNLSIDDFVLIKAKQYAKKNKLSLSKLVEDYLKRITNESIIEIVDRLAIPKFDKNIDFKKQYYEDRAEKYGFKK